MKLLIDYYKADDIVIAKDELFEDFPEENRPTNLRKKNRQGPQKVESNVKDIIDCFSAMAAAKNFEAPLIVTDDCNFPSLDLKHMDLAALCQDAVSLKKEFFNIREDAALLRAQAAAINDVKESLAELKSSMKESMRL